MGEMDELVRKAQEAKKQAEEVQEDAKKKRAEYISALNKLYADMATWMKGLVQAGMATVGAPTMTNAVDWFGEFSAPALQMTANNRRMTITPVSWRIIGWKGGSATIHIDPNIDKVIAQKDDGWVIFEGDMRSASEPLNADSFARAIKFLFP